MRAKKKGYAAGGKLKMVEKDGKSVPFYAADGKGKMKSGGKLKKYAGGGRMKGMDSPGEGVSQSDRDLLRHGNADFTTSLERMSKGSKSKKKAETKIPLPPSRKKPAAKKATGGKVKKMGLGGDLAKIAGSLSPVAGAITGKGMYGKASKVLGKGIKEIDKAGLAVPLLGMGAGVALNELRKKKSAPKSPRASTGKAMAMKKGGSPMHRMPDGSMMKGKVHKMKHGGAMCRGMGAATRGGNFKIG